MPHRLTPLATALLLSMLAPVSSSVLAAPAVAHWTVTDLGTLGGAYSYGYGINNAGQVTGNASTGSNSHAFLYSNGAMTDLGTLGGVISYGYGINNTGQVTGYSYTAGNLTDHAFLYSNGTMIDLGTLGGSWSKGYGINNAGQVTGWAPTAGNVQHAFLYSNGSMTDLGTLGGFTSYGYGINDFGHVTGKAQAANTADRAFLYSNGVMTDLGTLGGGYSEGYAINNAGQVTGRANTAGNASHAFLYSNGSMTDLGTLGGGYSEGYAINNAGQVTGWANTVGNAAQHAFLYSQGTMQDVNSFNGVAGSGLTLNEARSINDVGQIVGNGYGPTGPYTVVLTLDTTVWGGAPNASWDTADNWSHGIGPNKNTRVYIEPVGSRTILGPTGVVEVKQLTIGGNPADGGGIATLKLNGGQINLLAESNVGLELTANGVLTGQGAIQPGNLNGNDFYNYGRIVADDVTLRGMYVYNYGTIEGDGRLAADLGVYNYGGRIRIAHAGDRLQLDASVLNHVGAIDVIRGEVEINGELYNGSQVNLLDGTLRTGTMDNHSRFDISSGFNSVFGNIVNQSTGRIVLSGQGQTTFWNDVQNYGELRVSSGSVATFFGDFYARTGGTLTGIGSKYYEAGYFIGNSPGVATDSGSVAFGTDAFVEVEIGGLAAGNGDGFHDKLIVLGDLSLDGTLKLVSWKGFTGQAGESFDLFDWGTLSGTFDNIDSSGMLLAAGATLDTRRLYIDGTISVTAVPEPETWAMLLAGLGFVGFAVRRRDQVV